MAFDVIGIREARFVAPEVRLFANGKPGEPADHSICHFPKVAEVALQQT